MGPVPGADHTVTLEKLLSSLSMHVLIAPDKFKGTLSAAQAADANDYPVCTALPQSVTEQLTGSESVPT